MNENDWRILSVVKSVPGIGRRTAFRLFRALQQQQISADQIAGFSTQLIDQNLITEKQFESIKKNYFEQEKSLDQAISQFRDMHLVTFDDQEYPSLLRHSDDPPAFLYALGPSIDWWEASVVAVVGTRNMTEYGAYVTRKISSELADLGVIVVSGLMYGVDTAAHLAALEFGGQSVAVLGYGFQHCYPEDHQHHIERFKKLGGTLLSEYPPWQPAIAGQFPARNTIVAGMSEAVVVTEAAEQSGTMITVQSALDNGRQVFAVPGPIDNPYTSGTRYLLNQGATLVASGQDVLAQLNGITSLEESRGGTN